MIQTKARISGPRLNFFSAQVPIQQLMTQIMRKLLNDKSLLGVTGIHVVQIKTIGHVPDGVSVYSNLIFIF